MSKTYAGIGSRTITSDVKQRIHAIARRMVELNYTLRSGAADGSDEAFEYGCDSVNGLKEIYLPNKNFNDHPSRFYVESWHKHKEALKLAERVYGNGWNFITDWARNAHSRNVAQVLGWELDDPVEYVFCYTSNGKKIGGTATAMKLAESLNIPVINLYFPDVENFLKLM